MSIATFVFLGIFAALFLYAVTMYNNFVRLKNNVAQSWSNIDVLMKQRHDELPKLVQACKEYMKHERGVLEAVTEARAAVGKAREAGDVTAVGAAETQL
ncbi:MAG: LemA family protein, partial [Gammaproteobacteria bacterium]|nr:LemA family protein [Gammaproteobacteria bacterium]